VSAVDDGLGTLGADQLRLLVREVLAEVVGKLPPAAVRGAGHQAAGHGQSADAEAWTVRISSDEDLHAFALRVLKLADNPKLRRDLIGGRIRFTLAGQATGGPAAAHRVDKGAVTERTVAAAAKAGARLVLGPRAVLTPLARDKARALGVPIERPRGGWSDARGPMGIERPRGGLPDTRGPMGIERPRGGSSDARGPMGTEKER
jgi:pyruvate/2-oxoglutarate dehydrogenase complex dihydrolipoamide acyltransferase (E2) component